MARAAISAAVIEKPYGSSPGALARSPSRELDSPKTICRAPAQNSAPTHIGHGSHEA